MLRSSAVAAERAGISDAVAGLEPLDPRPTRPPRPRPQAGVKAARRWIGAGAVIDVDVVHADGAVLDLNLAGAGGASATSSNTSASGPPGRCTRIALTM